MATTDIKKVDEVKLPFSEEHRKSFNTVSPPPPSYGNPPPPPQAQPSGK